jgi:hypothetical protein
VIRFLNAKNIGLAKIRALVVGVCGEGAMKERNVMKLCRLLKQGRTNFHDEERSGFANSSNGKFRSTRPRVPTMHQVTVTCFSASINFWLARVRGETKRKQDVAQGRLKGHVAAF